MSNDLLDILSGKTTAITNEQLIKYLTGNLPDNEKHDIEKMLVNNGMDSEALEGLQMIENKEKLRQYELEIHKVLREKLHQKKTTRLPKKQLQLNYLLILTGALLALIILVWLLFHLTQTKI